MPQNSLQKVELLNRKRQQFEVLSCKTSNRCLFLISPPIEVKLAAFDTRLLVTFRGPLPESKLNNTRKIFGGFFRGRYELKNTHKAIGGRTTISWVKPIFRVI